MSSDSPREEASSSQRKGVGARLEMIFSNSEQMRLGWGTAAVVAVLALAAGVVVGLITGDQSHQLAVLQEEMTTLRVQERETQKDLDEANSEVAGLLLELEGIGDQEAFLEQKAASLAEREEEIAAKEKTLEEREGAVFGAEQHAEENSFGNGVHLVGGDIKPGDYRMEGAGGRCYWARLRGTSGDLTDLIANGIPDGPAVVTIHSTDVAFESSRCGTWSLIE